MFGLGSYSLKKHVAESLRVGLFLLLLTLVGLAAYTPWLGLVGDDWWFFAHLSDGHFPAAQLYENPARPVVAYLWIGLWRLFGLRLWAYYALAFTVQWLTALVVFIMFRNVLRWGVVDAATTAAMFLLYPADTTHVYLSTLSTRVCMLLAMTGAVLWLHAWKESSRSALLIGIAMILMTLSLLTYETPLFLFVFLPLALASIAWRGWHAWMQSALTCYVVLAVYLVFRLWVAYVLSQRPAFFYVSINLTPAWLCSQLHEFPAAAIWKGWLYTLKAMLNFEPVTLLVMLLIAPALLLLTLAWSQWGAMDVPKGWRENLRLVGTGVVLSAVAVAPVAVSSYSFENVVGTLDGRLVHGAALGHALLMTGLCALPASLLPLGDRGRALCRITLVIVLLVVALVGGLGVQREYAQAWHTQLDIVRALQEQAVAFRDGTVITLLDLPIGAFNIRFYYPFTELVRRSYVNPTLHVLPWQRGFPPDQQLLAFGQEYAVGVVEVVQKEVMAFDYSHMVAFKVKAGGELQEVQRIDSDYLCEGICQGISFSLPTGWEPASGPIALSNVQSLSIPDAPPDVAWRRFFLSQLDFATRVKLP
jgi:hypothetical protein